MGITALTSGAGDRGGIFSQATPESVKGRRPLLLEQAAGSYRAKNYSGAGNWLNEGYEPSPGSDFDNIVGATWDGANKEWDFDGVGDYIELQSTSVYDFTTGDYSIAMRFKANQTSTKMALFSKKWNNSGGAKGYVAFVESNRIYFQQSDGSNVVTSGNAAFTDTASFHTWIATSAPSVGVQATYLDGVTDDLDFLGGLGSISQGQEVKLGAYASDIDIFDGSITDFAVLDGVVMGAGAAKQLHTELMDQT